jgi:hypothetical protein
MIKKKNYNGFWKNVGFVKINVMWKFGTIIGE